MPKVLPSIPPFHPRPHSTSPKANGAVKHHGNSSRPSDLPTWSQGAVSYATIRERRGNHTFIDNLGPGHRCCLYEMISGATWDVSCQATTTCCLAGDDCRCRTNDIEAQAVVVSRLVMDPHVVKDLSPGALVKSHF
jgi:hypothetical protein